MLEDRPDHHDADLIIRLYDLRREPVMRESRARIAREFWPRTVDEALAVLKAEHPLNPPYRQVSTYWEMVYGMARHGIVHADYLVENNGEGLFLFAKIEPYLQPIRAAASPRAFLSAEWVSHNCDAGRTLLDGFRTRVRKALEAKAGT